MKIKAKGKIKKKKGFGTVKNIKGILKMPIVREVLYVSLDENQNNGKFTNEIYRYSNGSYVI